MHGRLEAVESVMSGRRATQKKLSFILGTTGTGTEYTLYAVYTAVLAKMGVPAHLIHVIKRMNADLKVTFDLNGDLPSTGAHPAKCTAPSLGKVHSVSAAVRLCNSAVRGL